MLKCYHKMNIVEAANKTEIAMVHGLLTRKYPRLYADIWKVGVNLSLRISDLLAIKYADLNVSKRSLKLIDKKTSKPNEVRLNNTVMDIINQRRNDYPNDEWLFQVHSSRANNKPISRVAVAVAFKKAGEQLGLTINTHSMRKSRGMALFEDGVPVEMIAKVLNHTNPLHTLRYLGITKEKVLATYDLYEL